MRRYGRSPRAGLLAVCAIAALASACARHEDHRAASDLKSAGADLKDAAASLARDADVKHAAGELKAAGHDAGKDLRKAAAEAKSAVHDLGADAKKAVHDADHSTDRD